MFSGSFSYKMANPLMDKSKSSSDSEEVKDSYVQGYNYHWGFTPFDFPFFTHSISEDKAGD